MDHHVVAFLGSRTGAVHVGPVQHHRAAVHRFTGQHFVVVVDHAVLVRQRAPRDHFARVHDDAHEIVVPLQAQVEDGQHRLRSDGQRHLVGDHEAVGAVEFLGGQELRSQFAQPRGLGGRPVREEGVTGQHGEPERVGNGGRSAAPAQPAEHQASAMRRAPPAVRRRASRRAGVAMRVPVAEHDSLSLAQQVVGRLVRVTVDHRLRAGSFQPGEGLGSVDVRVFDARALARLALLAQLPGDLPALRQGPRQEIALPVRRAHLLAKLHVFGVRQAQRVAMREQPALAGKAQHGRVGQQRGAAGPQEALADQEVAVAVHEEHCEPAGGCLQHTCAIGGEARLEGRVVADPDLEQVAQDEDGVGRRLAHVAPPGIEGSRLGGLQVQVRDEIGRAPGRRRLELREIGQGREFAHTLRVRARRPSRSPGPAPARRRGRPCCRS